MKRSSLVTITFYIVCSSYKYKQALEIGLKSIFLTCGNSGLNLKWGYLWYIVPKRGTLLLYSPISFQHYINGHNTDYWKTHSKNWFKKRNQTMVWHRNLMRLLNCFSFIKCNLKHIQFQTNTKWKSKEKIAKRAL